MRRLALKRPAGNGPDENKKRPAPAAASQPVREEQQQQPTQVGTAEPNWAADFAAEVDASLARQQGAGQQAALLSPAAAGAPGAAAAQPVDISEPSMDDLDRNGEHSMSSVSSPGGDHDDEESRQGLLKVVESMRRRVDEGHLQLQQQQRLLQQKQQLVARGEAVLAQHCSASWQHLQQQGSSSGISVHSLQAECLAGQWWLQANISIPQSQLAPGSKPSLLAASTTCSLACRQQWCTATTSTSSSIMDSSIGEALVVQLQLAAALDVRQQQQQQQPHSPGGPWADVFLLIEQPANGGQGTAAFAPEALLGLTVAAAPPVLLGRVQLDWQQWLKSGLCSRDASSSLVPSHLRQQQQEQQQQQHSRTLAVTSQQMDLGCLRQIVQQQLGCIPAPGADGSSAGTGPAQQTYVLQPGQCTGDPAPTVALAPASVSITQHSSQFAEVRLQASNTHLLEVLQQQLAAALQQAAYSAGAPPGDVSVGKSLLSAQHAQQQADAAEALVQELDASIEWLEALLKERLALDSQHRRHKVALNPTAVQQRQAAALQAMATTDGLMVSLLS